jgi:ubiquinone/menaquinone biosynthesis C-methylase UbiE
MDMLNQARNPIYSDQMDIDRVSLICGDAHSIAFPPNSIDFIYSIGTLGESTHIDVALLGSLHSILAPGGRLFVTIVSTTSRIQAHEHKQTGLVVRILRKAFPYFPHFIRISINQLLGSHYLTRSQLEIVHLKDGR